MLMHTDLMLTLVNDHHRELIAEADRQRLLTSARQARKTRRRPATQGAQAAADRPAARGRPAGNLAPCEPSAAVPAR